MLSNILLSNVYKIYYTTTIIDEIHKIYFQKIKIYENRCVQNMNSIKHIIVHNSLIYKTLNIKLRVLIRIFLIFCTII